MRILVSKHKFHIPPQYHIVNKLFSEMENNTGDSIN